MKRLLSLLVLALLDLGTPVWAQERPPTIRDDDPQVSNPLLPPFPSIAPPVSATPLGAVPISSLVPLQALPGYLGPPGPVNPSVLPPQVTAPPPPNHRLTFRLDYLLWAFDRPPIRTPLLTTGPRGQTGIIGESGSAILAGKQRLNFDPSSGIRLWGEWLLNPEYRIAVEGSYFVLERTSDGLSFASDATGNPLLARPYLRSSGPASLVIAAPGISAGDFNLAATLRLQGAHLALTSDILRCESLPVVRFLFGVQGLDLSESIRINTTTTPLVNGGASFLGTAVNPPGSVSVFDSFSTSNRFIGLLLGLRLEHQFSERFSIAVTPRVALGPNYQHADVEGFSTLSTTPGGTPTSVLGGFLAQRTNIVSRNNVRVSVVPQLGAQLTGKVTDWLYVRVGYEGLYWKTVLRPGSQIDQSINRTQIVTAPEFAPTGDETRPILPLQTREFWAQGLTLGVELRY